MSKWQPIETAPKDGTQFIAWTAREGFVPWVYWDDGDEKWPAGWMTEFLRWSGRPTHWMPLPEPPADSEASA